MPSRYPVETRKRVVELARSGTRVAQLARSLGNIDASRPQQTPQAVGVRVRLEHKTGREHGQTTFTSWDKAVTLTAPADAIDISQLEHHA